MVTTCIACGAANASSSSRQVQICSGCRLVHYCGSECQKKDWSNHKASCKRAKKESKLYVEDLWFAAKDGDLKVLRQILKTHPASINMLYSQDRGMFSSSSRAVEIAGAAGQTRAVKILLDRGADQHKGDGKYAQTPLHRAAEGGHFETVQLLLSRGAQILKPDSMGQTALHFAAEHGHTDLCKYLLEKGAGPCLTVPYRGKTPRVWALMNGHHECAALL